MSKPIMPRGMKIGAVSLWLLLLLSERPMYSYEIIRELEKRFSGYWKPQTGTIYPALEKLESGGLLTSQIEFRDEAKPDRKHYALTEKRQAELSQTIVYWTKMTEILENYTESHESIFRYKSEMDRKQLSLIFSILANSLSKGRAIEMNQLFAKEKLSKGRSVRANPTDPVAMKFLYAKENHKLEIHMELEWVPT